MKLFEYPKGDKTVKLKAVFDYGVPSCEDCYLYNEDKCSDFSNKSLVDGHNCANHPEQTFHFEEVKP